MKKLTLLYRHCHDSQSHRLVMTGHAMGHYDTVCKMTSVLTTIRLAMCCSSRQVCPSPTTFSSPLYVVMSSGPSISEASCVVVLDVSLWLQILVILSHLLSCWWFHFWNNRECVEMPIDLCEYQGCHNNASMEKMAKQEVGKLQSLHGAIHWWVTMTDVRWAAKNDAQSNSPLRRAIIHDGSCTTAFISFAGRKSAPDFTLSAHSNYYTRWLVCVSRCALCVQAFVSIVLVMFMVRIRLSCGFNHGSKLLFMVRLGLRLYNGIIQD